MRLRASMLLCLALAAACTGGNGGNGHTPPEPTVKTDAGPGAGGPSNGWTASGPHRQESDGCRQMWTCACGPAKPGCKIKKPSDTSTLGVCAADEGPVNGCTRCLVMEPADPCKCESVCP